MHIFGELFAFAVIHYGEDAREKINCIRDECLNLLEKQQEHQEELVHVLSNMPSTTLQNLSQTSKMYFSLGDEILLIKKNLDIIEMLGKLHQEQNGKQ